MSQKARETNAGKNFVFLEFAIGQKVLISEIDTKARILSCSISRDGTEYSLRYFNDQGARVTEWFHADELESI